MNVTILGNNSALPAHDRHPTAQFITLHTVDLLLDCGEGTQMQMARYGVKWRRLTHIFISHLHGDHYLGLPGLLNSMSLLGRTAPLTVAGPVALGELLALLKSMGGGHPYGYEVRFQLIDPARDLLLADTPEFSVEAFPVEHRIECYGFLVTQKSKGRKLLVEKAEAAGVPVSFYNRLKAGDDYVGEDGTVISGTDLTEDGPAPKRYAYCADTRYTESYLEVIRGADAIYHESTFLEEDAEKATQRFHSTARQAATIAQKAQAQRLLLGHYSSRYQEVHPFADEAAILFPEVTATVEGHVYEI
ncbi:MAG: ribonuclease Z [Sphingobacteriales bacterium]|nr:MAG: ribonuclease Z [Sphingobacteriales bacterium]